MKIIKTTDKEYAKTVLEAIKNNNGYCPCALEKTNDTKCMCKAFREMERGVCHCGLYVKY